MTDTSEKYGKETKKASPKQMFKPGTIKRLLIYMAAYRVRMIIVVICILVSAATGAGSSIFIRYLIDDYITPLIGQTHPVFTEMFRFIMIMAMKEPVFGKMV